MRRHDKRYLCERIVELRARGLTYSLIAAEIGNGISRQYVCKLAESLGIPSGWKKRHKVIAGKTAEG